MPPGGRIDAVFLPFLIAKLLLIKTIAGADRMQQIENGYRGLRLLLDLNWDRVLWPAAIATALTLGGYAVNL